MVEASAEPETMNIIRTSTGRENNELTGGCVGGGSLGRGGGGGCLRGGLSVN